MVFLFLVYITTIIIARFYFFFVAFLNIIIFE